MPFSSISARFGCCRPATSNSCPRNVPSRWILSCKSMIDWSSCSGRGGQPGTYISTGMKRSIPCTTQYVSNTPPVEAQAPIEMHHFGSCICCQIRLQHRQHLHHHSAGDDHQIALPGTKAKHLGAEAGDIVLARAGRHQLDSAAGGGKRHRPEAVLARPARQRIEATDHHIVRHVYRHRNTPFRQAYAKPNPSRAMNTITSPNTSPRLSTSLPTAESMPTIC